MAVCLDFTLQMMMWSSGWQTLEGEATKTSEIHSAVVSISQPRTTTPGKVIKKPSELLHNWFVTWQQQINRYPES